MHAKTINTMNLTSIFRKLTVLVAILLLATITINAQESNEAYYDSENSEWVVDPGFRNKQVIAVCDGTRNKIRVNTTIHGSDVDDACGEYCNKVGVYLGIVGYQHDADVSGESALVLNHELTKSHGKPIFGVWGEVFGKPRLSARKFATIKDGDHDPTINFTFELNPDWVENKDGGSITFIVYQSLISGGMQCDKFGYRELCRFQVKKSSSAQTVNILPRNESDNHTVNILPNETIKLEVKHDRATWEGPKLEHLDVIVDYTRNNKPDAEVPRVTGSREYNQNPPFRKTYPMGYFDHTVDKPGTYTYQYSLTDKCGTVHTNSEDDGTPFEFEVSYPCGDFSFEGVSFKSDGEISEPEEIIYRDTETSDLVVSNSSYRVEPGATVWMDFSQEPSLTQNLFNQFYQSVTNTSTGIGHGNNVEVSPSSFLIPEDVQVARYTITPAFKQDVMEFTDCNPVSDQSFSITVGGEDQVYSAKCLLTLPSDLIEDDNIQVNPKEYEWLFETFKWTFQSKRGVILEDGMVLTDGAIVEVINPHIQDAPKPEADDNINFSRTTTYDEYGWVTSDAKSYFDDLGQVLQVQTKNLEHDVLMGAQTIYDMYGRPTLATLPAPMKAIHYQYDAECEDEVQVGGNIEFGYDSEFVLDEYLNPYSYRNFDVNYLGNDEPDPVDKTTEGTLGWYYSENNFIPTIKLDKVVLSKKAEGENTAARKSLSLAGGFSSSRGETASFSLDTDLEMLPSELEALSSVPRTREDNVPVTKYPFSVSIYNQDGSQEMVTTLPPGDYHQLGSGHEGDARQQQIESADIPIIQKYLHARAEALSISYNETLLDYVYKNTFIDANGNAGATYHDNSGNEIITLAEGPPQKISYKIYNNKGEIIAEVSPNGVNNYKPDGGNWSTIDKTVNRYNFRGQLIWSYTNDGGEVEFMYDKQGRLKYSQNEVQKDAGKFSFTNYDKIGRVVESGVYNGSLAFGSANLKAIINHTNNELSSVSDWTTGERTEIKGVVYDYPYVWPDGTISGQDFTHGKVSYTYIKDNANDSDHKMIQVYSYDHMGRMVTTEQLTSDNLRTKLDYTYNSTGNIAIVSYQSDHVNFYHYYLYDKSLKLKEVYVSTERYSQYQAKHLATKIANYEYYKHGPLKRAEIGRHLQGIDYVYNINGWLKSINNTRSGFEAGGDGGNGVGVDIFAMNLEYFNGDYTSNNDITSVTNIQNTPELFDGNIRAMEWMTKKPTAAYQQGASDEPVMYAYNYDKHSQLTSARFGVPQYLTGVMENLGNAYAVDVDYTGDLNGNIAAIRRHDESAGILDDFSYNYTANTNQLASIPNYGTYNYNAIGQLESDNITYTHAALGARDYTYNTAGLVERMIIEREGDIDTISYEYDVNGFRSKKIDGNKETFYARDMSGKLLAIYERANDSEEWVCTDIPIYAADRVGTVRQDPESNNINFTFEHKNHLGNVVNTYAPKDNLFGITPVILADVYQNYDGETVLRDIFTNINNFDAPGTEIGTVVATLTNKEKITGTAVMNADREVEIQNIVSPIKYEAENFETNLGRYYFDLPERTVTANIVTNNRGEGTVSNVRSDFNNSLEAGVLIQAVSGTVSTEGESMQGLVYANGTGGVLLTNVVSGETNTTYTNYTFELPARTVSAEIIQGPDGSLRAEKIIKENFSSGEVGAGELFSGLQDTKHVLGANRKATAFIRVNSQTRELEFEYLHIDTPLSLPTEKYVGRTALFFTDYEAGSNNIDILSYTDYYPFGSPMPGRKYVPSNPYRFGYQGQFAEKDEETGYNQFQLRLYDSRINRWLTTDPYNQYHSPYMAMGNNPLKTIDPNGGIGLDWFENTVTGERKFVRGQTEVSSDWGDNWVNIGGDDMIMDARMNGINYLYFNESTWGKFINEVGYHKVPTIVTEVDRDYRDYVKFAEPSRGGYGTLSDDYYIEEFTYVPKNYTWLPGKRISNKLVAKTSTEKWTYSRHQTEIVKKDFSYYMVHKFPLIRGGSINLRPGKNVYDQPFNINKSLLAN
jgi:RHS repeat-associated protein